MDRQVEDLKRFAEQIEGALHVIIDALREAIPRAHGKLAEDGLDPSEDPSLFSHLVRRSVRETLKASFPTLSQLPANMSPIHLFLGPHQLKMNRALNGSVPPPKTDARREYFAANDLGLMAFNIYPPDGFVEVQEDTSTVELANLVLLWDAKGSELNSVKLCCPSIENWPGPSLELFTIPVAEEDLQIQRQASEEEDSETGTGGDGHEGEE